MKKMKLVLALILALPLTFFAQSVEGSWKITFPGPDNTTMDAVLTLTGGNYTVDLGNDGSINVEGTYAIEGDQITVQDTKGDQACIGDNTAGKYTFTVDDKSFVMTKVNDPCEGRGGPEGKMAFTRI